MRNTWYSLNIIQSDILEIYIFISCLNSRKSYNEYNTYPIAMYTPICTPTTHIICTCMCTTICRPIKTGSKIAFYFQFCWKLHVPVFQAGQRTHKTVSLFSISSQCFKTLPQKLPAPCYVGYVKALKHFSENEYSMKEWPLYVHFSDARYHRCIWENLSNLVLSSE